MEQLMTLRQIQSIWRKEYNSIFRLQMYVNLNMRYTNISIFAPVVLVIDKDKEDHQSCNEKWILEPGE